MGVLLSRVLKYSQNGDFYIMQSTIVRTEKLSKTYETGETEVQALKDASISIECGEVVAIIGASG